MNYSLIPDDTRSNSYLENYNKKIDDYFGKKHLSNWLNFINFIKSESVNSLEKLKSNANSNVRYKEKFSKFGIEKYNEKKTNVSNINWIRNINNSCRYDSFITLFAFVFNPYIEGIEDKKLLNKHILKINEFVKKIIETKNSEYQLKIWKYFIDNKIDILSNDSDGFGKFGYVAQLFAIFKNSKLFCLQESQISVCKLCKNKVELPWLMKSSLLEISKEMIQIKSFPLILDYLLAFDNQGDCDFCLNNYHISNTTLINYKISEFSDFLFIIFDMSYNDICLNISNIKEIIKEEIKFNDDIKYFLSSIICIPYEDHFTIYLHKIEDIKNIDKENLFCYYHDDIDNNGDIIILKDLNNLYNLAKPYIIIYKKII